MTPCQLGLSFPQAETPKNTPRLSKQLVRVRDFFLAHVGEYFTLRQISDAAGAPEASASARWRDLRKMGRTHGWIAETVRFHNSPPGLYHYRLLLRRRS